MVALAEILVLASIVHVQKIIPVLDVNMNLMHAKPDSVKMVHHALTKAKGIRAYANLDLRAKIVKMILPIVKKHRVHRVQRVSIYQADFIVNVHSI